MFCQWLIKNRIVFQVESFSESKVQSFSCRKCKIFKKLNYSRGKKCKEARAREREMETFALKFASVCVLVDV